jgi:hypothetical protein
MGAGTFIVVAIFNGVVRVLTPAPAKDRAPMRRALPNAKRHHRVWLADSLPLSRVLRGFSRQAMPAALSIQDGSLVYRRGSSAIVARTPVSVRDA